MAKIILSVPSTEYKSVLDSNVMDVEIRDTFIGVTFVALDGRKMYVSERDGYFEVIYEEEPPMIRKGILG